MPWGGRSRVWHGPRQRASGTARPVHWMGARSAPAQHWLHWLQQPLLDPALGPYSSFSVAHLRPDGSDGAAGLGADLRPSGNTCGDVFTAEAPEGVGSEKYDASSTAMVALMKYGSGFPFHRLERL